MFGPRARARVLAHRDDWRLMLELRRAAETSRERDRLVEREASVRVSVRRRERLLELTVGWQ